MPSDALELETRQRIFQHVKKVPGTHMREIGREAGIPMGTLEYHLHYLVKAGILVTREDGRYTRYFASDEGGRRERDILACIRQETPRRITAHLLLTPGDSHGRILQHFQMSASTLSFHLKKLVQGTVIRQVKEGRENRYWVNEPDLVAKVLITYRKSFLDDVIDRFAEVWGELSPVDEAADGDLDAE